MGLACARGKAAGGKVGAAEAEVDVGVVEGDVHELEDNGSRRRVSLTKSNGKPPVRHRPSMEWVPDRLEVVAALESAGWAVLLGRREEWEGEDRGDKDASEHREGLV